jgi:acyl-coenzyme A synthetase/AMP-(fatty) acid ligase
VAPAELEAVIRSHPAVADAALRDELQQSVQQRIEETVKLGCDYGHSERLAEEQALIISIEKHFADR